MWDLVEQRVSKSTPVLSGTQKLTQERYGTRLCTLITTSHISIENLIWMCPVAKTKAVHRRCFRVATGQMKCRCTLERSTVPFARPYVPPSLRAASEFWKTDQEGAAHFGAIRHLIGNRPTNPGGVICRTAQRPLLPPITQHSDYSC